MNLLFIVVPCAIVLITAYKVYGSVLVKLFRLDGTTTTPAVELRDDVDYEPIESKFLLGQHFSAIAAAGPVVGPILACLMFGWLPAVLWILVGSIFIGGVHDFGALVASVRHKARSIPDVVREHMSHRSYILFLAFVWIALVYIIVAFTDAVALSFVDQRLEETITIPRGAIASSSLIYLVLPIIMGLLLRFTKLSLNMATVIFLPLVGVSIWAGQFVPLDITALIYGPLPADQLPAALAKTVKIWAVLLIVYCVVASLIPMWLLLQPRGHLGGYFLYVALLGGIFGIIAGGIFNPEQTSTVYPAFRGFTDPDSGSTVFPILFITIACGACSGFHSIIASGTTSKQLKNELDARPVGYGSMLLEAMVAILSVCCVMVFAPAALKGLSPNLIYAKGVGRFLAELKIPLSFGILFGLLAFTTFVYDTLDVCTRLGRYIIQELTGWKSNGGKYLATLLTAGIPLLILTQTFVDSAGNAVPAYKHFWSLFGASNQLLAALTLIGVTVWLHRTYKARWVWFVVGIPMVWMYTMSTWALLLFIKRGAFSKDGALQIPADSVSWVAIVLVALALLVLAEAIRVFISPKPPTTTPVLSNAAPISV